MALSLVLASVLSIGALYGVAIVFLGIMAALSAAAFIALAVLLIVHE